MTYNVDNHTLLTELPDPNGDLFVQQLLFEFHLLEALPTELQLKIWKIALPAPRNPVHKLTDDCPCANCFSCRVLGRLQYLPLPIQLKTSYYSRQEALQHYSLLARCKSGLAPKVLPRIHGQNFVYATWCFYTYNDEDGKKQDVNFLLLVKGDQQSAVLIENIEQAKYDGVFWVSHCNTARRLKIFWKHLGVPLSRDIDIGFTAFAGRKEFRVLDKFDSHLLPSDDIEDSRGVSKDFIANHRDELFGMAMREIIDVRPWGIYVFVEN